MKDKDPNEEEFNQDDQDNINEADDSFGLPDLDFTTLDDEPEAEEEIEEKTESEDEVEEIVVEEEIIIEEPVDSVVEEQPEYEEEVIITNEEDVEDTGEVTSDDDNGTGGGTGYVPPKPESNAPRIIAALIITVLVSGAIWYFAFYRPQKAAEEKARQEQIAKDEAAKAAAAKKKAEEERLAAEKAANEAADADEAASKEATFSTISEPTGRYYIVVASFIDADMASDLGNKLKASGVSSALLAPKGNKKFNRLTLGSYGSFTEAQEEANKLKGEYGDGLWVLKY